jgi:predicted dehydrogenase
MIDPSVTRRQFIGKSGKGAVAAAGVTTLLREAKAVEANEKVNVALIGCGGMGRYDLRDFMRAPEVNPVAVCDVDPKRLGEAAKEVEKTSGKAPQQIKDFRQVIDMKDVDVCIVGTPDHWHAAPMILACQAGKDVYVEKPCSHNVLEAKAMVEAAAKFKRVTQVGTQQRSGKHFKEVHDYIQAGKLGQITHTATWNYGNEAPDGLGSDPDSDPPPGVDYDMWLGAAPLLPFNKRRFHGSFRWYFDYAAGMVGDWNVHLQDIVHWALDAPAPTSVTSVGGKWAVKDDRDTPDTMVSTYQFPDFVHTYTMRKANGQPWHKGGYGIEFYGTNGTLFVNRQTYRIVPDAALDDDKKLRCEAIDFTRSADISEGDDQHMPHVQDFLDCVKSRENPICHVGEHFRTVVACHLANVSYKVGRQLFWSQEKMSCFRDEGHRIPDARANELLGRYYRKGYELPKV